jgi:AraC family transcriptional regulator of adaptative response/methylated-DNA-[protein]-cysteine methyltransferase
MKDNNTYQYNKVVEAIAYIEINFKEQPSFDAVANHVNLSSFQFQRLFKD